MGKESHGVQDLSAQFKLEVLEKSIQKCGLDDDAKNVWIVINPLKSDSELFDSVESVRKLFSGSTFEHYADYVNRSRGEGELATTVLEKSDSVKIEEFNLLVDKFNRHLAILQDELFDSELLPTWTQRAISIYDEAMSLFNPVQ